MKYSRRAFLRAGSVSALALACRDVSAPRCVPVVEPTIQGTRAIPEQRDLYLVDSFTGVSTGSKSNPFVARTADEYDAVIRGIASFAPYRLHVAGRFQTAGCYEYGTYAALGARLASGSAIVADAGSSLTLVPAYFDSAPLHVILSADGWATGKSGADAWAAVPVGESVQGLAIDGGYGANIERFVAAGLIFKNCGVTLQGHRASLEGLALRNFGAHGQESFGGSILGAIAEGDRHALAFAPADAVFDEAHITDCTFDGYDPSTSNDQYTVFIVSGAMCNTVITDTWAEVGDWRQVMRAGVSLERNGVVASGKNLVQGYTAYQSYATRVRLNSAVGVSAGYYGDFYGNPGPHTIEDNDFSAERGICLYLSPSAAGAPTAPAQFYHENYTIAGNRIRSTDVDVAIDTFGPSTDRRFIRNIAIQDDLTVRNNGATQVSRIPTHCLKAA